MSRETWLVKRYPIKYKHYNVSYIIEQYQRNAYGSISYIIEQYQRNAYGSITSRYLNRKQRYYMLTPFLVN